MEKVSVSSYMGIIFIGVVTEFCLDREESRLWQSSGYQTNIFGEISVLFSSHPMQDCGVCYWPPALEAYSHDYAAGSAQSGKVLVLVHVCALKTGLSLVTTPNLESGSND